MLDRFKGGVNQEGLRKLNAAIDTINRLNNLRGDDQFIVVRTGPGGANISLNIQQVLARVPRVAGSSYVVQQFRVVEEYDDYLDCYAYDDVDGPDDSQLIHVAKPFLLRRSPFDGQTRNGISYAYTNAYTRTATSSAVSEVELIETSYQPDDLIYAQQGVSGFKFSTIIGGVATTLNWLEQDSGRAWTTQES